MGRDGALAELAPMASRLEALLAACPPQRLRARPAPESFAPVEHLWHLADLEAKVYGMRLRRLRDEVRPRLLDFEGAAAAAQGNYLARDPFEALRRFRAAREANLAAFAALDEAAWNREGEQEKLGPLRLADLPVLMAAHDLDHWRELRLALL